MQILRDWFGGKIRFVLLLVVLFAAGVCSVSVGMELWQEWRTPPEQRVREAMRYATEAPAYCYSSEAVRVSDGKEQVITRLYGEKHGENVHLYGSAEQIQTEIDVYQIGDTFYRKDVVNGQWMVMTGQNIEATEYLMQEINPLGCLVVDGGEQVIAQGKEKLDGVTCKKYQVQSSGERTFLTSVWREFYYTVWIDKKHRPVQVELIADDHENNTEQLRLLVRFDWDRAVNEIKAPIS